MRLPGESGAAARLVPVDGLIPAAPPRDGPDLGRRCPDEVRSRPAATAAFGLRRGDLPGGKLVSSPLTVLTRWRRRGGAGPPEDLAIPGGLSVEGPGPR